MKSRDSGRGIVARRFMPQLPSKLDNSTNVWCIVPVFFLFRLRVRCHQQICTNSPPHAGHSSVRNLVDHVRNSSEVQRKGQGSSFRLGLGLGCLSRVASPWTKRRHWCRSSRCLAKSEHCGYFLLVTQQQKKTNGEPTDKKPSERTCWFGFNQNQQEAKTNLQIGKMVRFFSIYR